jgi:hypothetical protein
VLLSLNDKALDAAMLQRMGNKPGVVLKVIGLPAPHLLMHVAEKTAAA